MAAEVEIVINATDNASGTIGGLGGALGNLGNIVTGIKSAFDLAGMAIDAAVGFISPFVQSASESEQAVARLEGVLRATAGAAGLTSEDLQTMANRLQAFTRFSDEAILSGESILLTFRNIGTETFQRTVPAMLDMAEIFGSIDSAAMQLGKALNDPLAGMGALSRAGITFSEDQKKAIEAFVKTNDLASAQAIILAEVEAQVGGLAESMGDTFSGKMEIFKNNFDTLKESVGGFVISSLQPLITGFQELLFSEEFDTIVGFFDDLSRYAQNGIEPLAAIGYALNNLSPALHDIAMYFLQLQDVLRNGGNFGDVIAKFFGDIDYSGLMQTISDKITSLDWSGFSTAIAEGISSIDWGRVGNIIAEGLGHLTITILSVLDQINWAALLTNAFNAIADLIGGLFGFVDWEDMWSNAMIGFAYVGDQIINWIEELGQHILDWWDSIAWGDIGRNIMTGIMAGLTGNVSLLIDTVRSSFNLFINTVKFLFGISSPSSVFFNIARDIIQGLINGWNAFWGDLVDLATSSLDDFLRIFGIDISFGGTSAGGLGTAGGGTAGGTTTGGLSSGSVVNNYYGPVYFGAAGEPGAYYDCPSPHPLVASSGNQLVTSGF